MTESRTYPRTNPAALSARIQAAGGPAIDPTEDTGQATADGVTISWGVASVASGEEITVTVENKPWFVGYNTIWSHVDAVMGVSSH